MIIANRIITRHDANQRNTRRKHYQTATSLLEESCFYNKALSKVFKDDFPLDLSTKKPVKAKS